LALFYDQAALASSPKVKPFPAPSSLVAHRRIREPRWLLARPLLGSPPAGEGYDRLAQPQGRNAFGFGMRREPVSTHTVGALSSTPPRVSRGLAVG